MKAAGPNKTETQDVVDASCRVEMFGGLCLVRAGERVSRFARQKAGMLLAYLALSPGPHSRERLLDLFWPDMDLPASRDNLSTALASLRRQIEPPGVRRGSVLLATHTQVGLNAGAVTTDVAEFEGLLDQAVRSDTPTSRVARRRQAVALYRDGFLPGCYEDWAVRASDRLEARLLIALEALAQDQETLGALGDAQETARRRVELDAYSEDAHYQLIQLSVLAGHPQAGRAAWTRFEQTVASEFGAEPSPQTHSRIEQLLAAPPRFAPPPAPGTETPASSAAVSAPETVGASMTPRNPAAPPVVLSRFFGRETEMRQLINLLLPKDRAQALVTELTAGLEPPCRLVTLTGPGGIGKTRLAVETAQRLSERLSVWCGFAGLAEATTPGQIAGRIASALGIAPSADAPPLEQVAAFFAARDSLRAGPAVLVLDNLEHLLAEGDSEADLDGAEAVRLLLERMPSLTVLCTSRRRLGLRGERTLPVDPLPVPPLPSTDITAESLKTLAESPSVRLYLDRAQAVRPDFTLTTTNAPAVAALCRQLEGSPLALELAAAWVRTLPPRKMWERLTLGLDIPAGSYGDLPARHRSLSAALDWSRRLLTPAQQRLWARLSVFRGGWTVEAAEAVGEAPDAAALLADLAEASLVTTTETEAGEIRYGFLETVRAFGWTYLQEEKRDKEKKDEESSSAAARRHADYFGTLAATAEPNLRGPAQAEWLERLEQEHDNLRAVLTRHLAQDGDAEAGMHLAVMLARFWNVRGHWREGGRWLNLALAHPRSASLPPALRARALNAAAGFTKLLGDPTGAQMLFEESLLLRRQVGDLARVADTLHNLGYLALGQGRLARARALYEESLALCRQLDDTIGIADELHHLGLVAHEGGDLAEAQAWYEESLVLRRLLGDERGLAITLHNLGNIACSRGDLVLARTLHEESLAVRRQIGDRQGIAESLCGLGVIGLQYEDGAWAGALFFESLALYRQLGDGLGVACVLEGLAALALAAGDAGRAGRLYGAASARRETLEMPLSVENRQALEQTLASARGGPLASAFVASWEQGRSLTWEQAAEYAAGG